MSFYSGYIRCGSIKQAYLPERVLRQFGHVQGIPRSPIEVTGHIPSAEDIDQSWLLYHMHVVDEATRGPRATSPGQSVDDYMRWFHRISHPFVIPLAQGDAPRVIQTDIVESSSTDTHASCNCAVSLVLLK